MADASTSPSGKEFSLLRVVLAIIPIALVAWGIYAYSSRMEKSAQNNLEKTSLRKLLGDQYASTTLAGAYNDEDGDLIADVPINPNQFIEPDEVLFSYIASGDDASNDATWKELLAALSEKLDRPVNLVRFKDTDEQIDAVRNGRLHITAFGTGEVEAAVNQCGFVPVACFADSSGEYRYTMKIITRANSKIEKLDDIRGKRLTFTRPRSNSGCIAALVLLMKQHNLQPDADYNWGVSRSHENSIRGIASGEVEVAAVASDILGRMIADGEIEESSFRTIYESEPYPPGVIGFSNILSPTMAEAIRATLENFDWADTGLLSTFGSVGTDRFAIVNYKDDWAPVRALQADAYEIFSRTRSSDSDN